MPSTNIWNLNRAELSEMESIRIQTHQHLELSIPLAGFADRMLGYLLDFLFQIVLVIFLLIFGFAVNFLFQGDFFIVLAGSVIFLIPIGYPLLFESIMNGQTPGKRIMKTRVVKLDGSQAGFGSYLMRSILVPVDFMFTWGAGAVLSFFLSSRGQRIGDLAAGTTVIQLSAEDSSLAVLSPVVPEGYQVTYSEAERLEETDVDLIKDVLYNTEKIESREVLIRLQVALKAKLEKKLNISSTSIPESFLRTILRDHYYLKGRIV